MEKVSPHVYVYPDDGDCTVGAIVTPEGVVLVDTPSKPSRALRWRDETASLGQVRYIINTEHHNDHVFGNAFFSGVIIAHQETRDHFWDDSVFGGNPLRDPVPYVKTIDPQSVHLVRDYVARPPTISFDGRLVLELGDVVIRLLGMPGHLAANTVVYVPADRVLFTSDIVFNNIMIWCQQSLPFQWLETLDRLKNMEVEVVVPGHGRVAGPKVLDEMKQGVQHLLDEVRAAVDKGWTREEAIDRITFIHHRPVPELHRPVAPFLQRLFVGRLYDQVVSHRS